MRQVLLRRPRLMTENRRRAPAESYFEVGETEKAEELFEQWLRADPRWGWGWIGRADCYRWRVDGPKNYPRAEELLRRGYATPGERDRFLAARLAKLCEDTGRPTEARELERQYEQLQNERRARAAPRHAEKPSPNRPPDGSWATAVTASTAPTCSTRVSRNSPCPCGSGRKFKRCCGPGQRRG